VTPEERKESALRLAEWALEQITIPRKDDTLEEISSFAKRRLAEVRKILMGDVR